MKKVLLFVSLIIIIGVGGYYFYQKNASPKPVVSWDNHGCHVSANETWCALKNRCVNNVTDKCQAVTDYRNATYEVGRNLYTLAGGRLEVTNAADTSSSTTKTIVTLWGEPLSGDLNGDGVADKVSYLTVDSGGSGTFYYLVGAVSNKEFGTINGTKAVFLGDRIAPQNLEIKKGSYIVANYAVRKIDDPMTTKPSMGISAYFKIKDGQLVEAPNLAIISEVCQKNKGKWLTESYECEGGLNGTKCQALGGVYNECASACRNQATATVCTLQCVPVCKF